MEHNIDARRGAAVDHKANKPKTNKQTNNIISMRVGKWRTRVSRLYHNTGRV